MHTSNFYARSTIVALTLVAASLSACAHPNRTARDASHVAFADFNGPDRKALAQQLGRGASVIHFAAGERVPLTFRLDSTLAHVEDGDMTLTFDRDVYLLLRPDGPPLLSEDGVDFESGQGGSFQFGIRVTKDAPASMLLGIGLRTATTAASDEGG